MNNTSSRNGNDGKFKYYTSSIYQSPVRDIPFPIKHSGDFLESQGSSAIDGQNHGGKIDLDLCDHFDSKTVLRAYGLLNGILKKFRRTQFITKNRVQKARFLNHHFSFMIRLNTGAKPCELWFDQYMKMAGYS